MGGLRRGGVNDLLRARTLCPKSMINGPCGGVRASGACEVDAELPCPYLDILDTLPWRRPVILDETHPRSSHLQGGLERALHAGKFVVIAEAYTPDSADLSRLIETYRVFQDRITAVNIAEHALASPHASSLAAAALFEKAGLEAILNLTCRDHNRIGLQGEILGVAALGVKNLFCVTGDHPALGDHPEATAVFDLDSLELISLAKTLRDEGRFLSGRRLEHAPNLFIGAAANPFTRPAELQAERVAAKVVAGARFIQTQAVFGVADFERFVAQLRSFAVFEHAHLIAGVAVVTTLEQALWLQRHVPGARVPDALVAHFRLTPESKRRAFGLAYTSDLIAQLRAVPDVSGVLLFPLGGDVLSLREVLEHMDSQKADPEEVAGDVQTSAGS